VLGRLIHEYQITALIGSAARTPVQRELLASPLAKRDASRQPSAAFDRAQLKNELRDRIAGRPDASDEALVTEIVQRHRS
jgi:hypothetical protein